MFAVGPREFMGVYMRVYMTILFFLRPLFSPSSQDVFAVGPRELMGMYMTIFRGCLYSARSPLYHTHPRSL